MADRREGYDAVIAAPFGRLGIHAQEALTSIDFVSNRIPLLSPRTLLARKVCALLKAYFANPNTHFDVPLAPGGTDFQQRAWRALRRIPSGTARTYGELAHTLKSAPRAVGGACRANPIPIVVPCHRVVAANGPGGFMGATRGRALDIKRWLLVHESTD
jgi:methylated-DNA-[protein]-cysteine S-methyltransferase